MTEFKVGDRVRRLPRWQDDGWEPGSQVLTVTAVREDGLDLRLADAWGGQVGSGAAWWFAGCFERVEPRVWTGGVRNLSGPPWEAGVKVRLAHDLRGLGLDGVEGTTTDTPGWVDVPFRNLGRPHGPSDGWTTATEILDDEPEQQPEREPVPQWFLDALNAKADSAGLCSLYDEFLAEQGLPPRKPKTRRVLVEIEVPADRSNSWVRDVVRAMLVMRLGVALTVHDVKDAE